MNSLPRVVVAGLSGDSGKTLVSLGLLLMARERGIHVRGFKKGPDYIDAAWLRWASGDKARNLDTFLMGFDKPVYSFGRHAVSGGLNVIEGNRGLHDGSNAQGTHSTAELAKTLRAPVILVLTATKVTRTAAAFVMGCQHLDPDVNIAGVVLNKVSTRRHERVLQESIESACNVPVVGCLLRAKSDRLLPGRHLGLVTPEEHPRIGEVKGNLLELVEKHLDFGRIREIGANAKALPDADYQPPAPGDGKGLRIGYLVDSAFTFYYPENLEALEDAGAELVPISALFASKLPDELDALYIGGGFPETHGAGLSSNKSFHASLRGLASEGLPIYAECGGLMLLAKALHWKGERFEMSGVFPFEVEVCQRPQGHGYVTLVVERDNPFYANGLWMNGHEFHYSRIMPADELPSCACVVTRGTGCYNRRDGALANNVWASYTHIHALATPEWASGFLRAARGYASARRHHS